MEYKRKLTPMFRLLLLFVISTGLTACANRMYYWGNYEEVIYSKHNTNSSPNRDIELLLLDKKNASAAGKPLPPGFHSHLGMLLFDVGNYSMATEEFSLEKQKYPESETLMNRFLKVKNKK